MDPLDGTTGAQSDWASSEDWTKYKSLIMRLYREHPLKNVKEMMEDDHGFKAT